MKLENKLVADVPTHVLSRLRDLHKAADYLGASDAIFGNEECIVIDTERFKRVFPVGEGDADRLVYAPREVLKTFQAYVIAANDLFSGPVSANGRFIVVNVPLYEEQVRMFNAEAREAREARHKVARSK